jgi:hypothetical protein
MLTEKLSYPKYEIARLKVIRLRLNKLNCDLVTDILPINVKATLSSKGVRRDFKLATRKSDKLKCFTKLKFFLRYSLNRSLFCLTKKVTTQPSNYLNGYCRHFDMKGGLSALNLHTMNVNNFDNLVLSQAVFNNKESINLLFSTSRYDFSSKGAGSYLLKSNITPWVEKTINSFISSVTGMRSLLQFYPSLSSEIEPMSVALYRNWLPRLSYYQKRLGHRFFMEETMHIMHLSLKLHDATLFSTWLTSLINRISFWKTRSIFRYLLYLFKNFFLNEFSSIGCKGLKIRLKGKISAAGNSRKRRINFKFGKVSYSTLKNKCLSKDSLISTFTGVMCLRTEIFY